MGSASSRDPTNQLLDAGLKVVSIVINQIHDDVLLDPEVMLSKVTLENGKRALRIDVDSEDTFSRELHKYHRKRFRDIKVYGEERLNDPLLDLTDKPGIFALVDMVDGTDLVERGLSNWCSAAVFFCPTADPGSKILAAFVGVPSGDIYYATSVDAGAWVKLKGQRSAVPVKGPSVVRDLRAATICFYGQKATNLRSVIQLQLLQHLFELENPHPSELGNTGGAEGDATTDSPNIDNHDMECRLYTLAGIPMMVKLCDHRIKTAKNIDLVFEVKGQNPHDVVPGAFIAKKGGAVLRTLEGKPIEYSDLELALLKPSASKLTYVLGSTSELCDQFTPLLREPDRAVVALTTSQESQPDGEAPA